MILDRDFLITLRNTANEYATVDGRSSDWARAYLNLSDAANFLDAMIARTGVFEVDEE